MGVFTWVPIPLLPLGVNKLLQVLLTKTVTLTIRANEALITKFLLICGIYYTNIYTIPSVIDMYMGNNCFLRKKLIFWVVSMAT